MGLVTIIYIGALIALACYTLRRLRKGEGLGSMFAAIIDVACFIIYALILTVIYLICWVVKLA
jgi:hypothetical protein